MREVGVVVDVDEARRDREAGCVDGACRGLPGQSSHRRDPSLPDADIAEVRRIAGAIDDVPAANQQIEILCGCGRKRQQKQPEFHKKL